MYKRIAKKHSEGVAIVQRKRSTITSARPPSPDRRAVVAGLVNPKAQFGFFYLRGLRDPLEVAAGYVPSNSQDRKIQYTKIKLYCRNKQTLCVPTVLIEILNLTFLTREFEDTFVILIVLLLIVII